MFMLAAVQAVDEGLTVEEIVSSLPFDPFSIFALVLLAASFAAVLYFGTRPWMAPEEPPVEGGSGSPSTSLPDPASRRDGPKGSRRAA